MTSALPFTDELHAALGGAPDHLAALSDTGEGDLPSVYRVTDLAVAAIGVAGLAASELVGSVTGSAPAVAVDRALASTWFGSAVDPIGWTLPSVWDPLARNYRASDGWIRLHTNAPHHRAAALAVLGGTGDFFAVRRAVGHRSAVELETAIVDAGGCAAVMRSPEQWLAHPQGAAVAQEPLLDWATGEAGARGLSWTISPSSPLGGLRVLDLTRVIAGPVATRFLAALGADVLRVDPPGWEEEAIVPNMTLGKRSARLDAKTPAGRDRLSELIRRADVVVHGYRAGALDALGFDAETRQRLRPGLIDVSLDAYGFTGPWAGRRGFDSLVQMSSGIPEAGMAWAQSAEPTPLPVQALDHATGYLLAAAAMRALSMQREDGPGRQVRTSLARVAMTLVNGGPQRIDGPLVERSPATELLATPWGPAMMLRSPVDIAGTPFEFTRGPCELGSHPPQWD
ncbi:MAG: CoA transferase [Burkholderiaceae bacterium]|nr:CoA transferase [Microbacteriaceae bacterium]